jgi:23S rRNA (cytidine1920-2'-O)/16S rRNA (cytidine1409-2'-O)-methyltransferase
VPVKVRIDKLLVDRGLAPSRERAQALILAGKVLANQQKIEKPGAAIEPDAQLRLLGDDLKYVSRGGLKLEAALNHWRIDVNGKVCADVGASTGGFTDCLLQRGAARVIAIDTGYGQIDLRVRKDPRVRLLEKTNARYLTPSQLGERVDLVCMDVSFISATLVLPAVHKAVDTYHRDAQRNWEAVILVKPQFEVGRQKVAKGGIVRDDAARQEAVGKVRQSVCQLAATAIDVIDSPITGAEGNCEFLLRAVFRGGGT